jgi:MFS family permease
MRWITRGCLGVAVVQAIMEPWVSRLHRSQLDAVAILSVWLQAAGMAGATAMSWYLSRLAARLRDRILRALWVCLAFVLGILFALLAIGFASDWKETVHEEALRLSASGAEATAASVRFWSSTPFWAIVGLCLAVFCLATPWRLHFKLIAARKRLISQAKCRRGG